MEVFHYVAEKLRVYPHFKNGKKIIKISKERGVVYSDFDFDSTELLSECTSKIAYFVYSLNSDALVPQMSSDHAILELDNNN